ncbi:MAG: FHA domain protein [Firmicutes bacterium ADurb.Bin080]|nr:MAG: FHA domain protein [Firmicutes bacterium ADurb.Bin080]
MAYNDDTSSIYLEHPRGSIQIKGNTDRIFGREDFSFLSSDESSYISRKTKGGHFAINSNMDSYGNIQFFIRDLGSANGTLVNGRDIKGTGKQALRNGDSISLGGIVPFRVRATEAKKNYHEDNTRISSYTPVSNYTPMESKSSNTPIGLILGGAIIGLILIGIIVGGASSGTNSVSIFDPCKNVTCSNTCQGYDLWSQKCDKGNCVPSQKLESCSEKCGCIPDIKIAFYDSKISWNITEGFVANVSLTLTNYGPADGTAKVEFYNDRNQILAVEDYWVPSQGSKSFVKKIDISMGDDLRVRIRSQRKS